MSGGSFDYSYEALNEYEGLMLDSQLNELLEDFQELLKSLEWAASDDISFNQYLKNVEEYKGKWMDGHDIEIETKCWICGKHFDIEEVRDDEIEYDEDLCAYVCLKCQERRMI